MQVNAVNYGGYVEPQNKVSKVRTEYFDNVLLSSISNQKKCSGNDIHDIFRNLNANLKFGDCKVSKAKWGDENFPFWKYFDKYSSVEEVNDWKVGVSKLSSAEKQAKLKKINFGEMVIVIPNTVKEKMVQDSHYAEEIYRRISKWKENYDKIDNIMAASYGLNVPIYQFSKSYCITLDEDGNVDKYMVISGGLDDSNRSVNNQGISSKNDTVNTYSELQIEKEVDENDINMEMMEKEEKLNFLYAMSILGLSFLKK